VTPFFVLSQYCANGCQQVLLAGTVDLLIGSKMEGE